MKRWFGLCLGILLLLGATACGNKAPTWQEQYDLGIRYLNDGDYEEAVIAFTAAIEIDPMQVDTYYALANTYIAQNDFEQAREILVKGVEKTGAQKLQDLIDAIDSGNIVDYWGNIRKMAGYDGNGNLLWWHEYTYDEKRIPVASTSYDSNGNQTGQVFSEFDEHGNQIVGPSYDTGTGVVCRYESKYDDDGNEIEFIEYNQEGKIESRTANEYDEVGNCIKTSYYDSDGSLNQYYLFSYDANGNAIREDSYNADGQLSWYHVNEYDAAGNQIKVTSYDSENRFQGYDQGADKNTRKLRSGYPTDHLTVRREPEQPIMSGTAILQESTAQLEIEQGDTLPDTAVLPKAEFPQAQQTEKLRVGTVPLADGTIPPVHDEDTVPLYDRATPPDGETEVLDSSMQAGGTEKLGVTTPLSDSQRK